MALFPAEKKALQTSVLDTVQSSRGAGSYEIRLGKDSAIYCTCPGWIHSKKNPKMCRHLSVWVLKNFDRLLAILTERFPSEGDAKAQAFLDSANEYDGKRA